jgi:alpha-D-xyloside xylohydrolase
MKFTDGYWQKQPGYTPLYAVEVDDIRIDTERGKMVVFASTTHVTGRGDTLNRPLITVTYSATAPGVVGVEVVHHSGRLEGSPSFALDTADAVAEVSLTESYGVLRSGDLEVRVARSGPWHVDFVQDGRVLTSSLPRSLGAVLGEGGHEWMHEQLSLEPGEQVYGLGERFGAFTKNGQVVDIWNRTAAPPASRRTRTSRSTCHQPRVRRVHRASGARLVRGRLRGQHARPVLGGRVAAASTT